MVLTSTQVEAVAETMSAFAATLKIDYSVVPAPGWPVPPWIGVIEGSRAWHATLSRKKIKLLTTLYVPPGQPYSNQPPTLAHALDSLAIEAQVLDSHPTLDDMVKMFVIPDIDGAKMIYDMIYQNNLLLRRILGTADYALFIQLPLG